MKLGLLAVQIALCSAKAIPQPFPVSQDVALDAGDLQSDSWGLEPRAQKSMPFDRVKAEMEKELNIKAVDGQVKLKWDLKNTCSKCKGKNQVEDKKNKNKCKDCKKGTKPNSDHTKCVPNNDCKDNEIKKPGGKCEKCPDNKKPDDKGEKCEDKKDNDCEKNEIKKPGGKCEKCPANKKPDSKGEKCEDKKGDGTDKEKGKCPDGKILDPAEGGQDANTKDPACVPDKKCPKGQSPESRRTDYKEAKVEPDCYPDDDRDHKCKDKNTYDHRMEVDGKIKHSCRSTNKAKEDKKDKYQKHVDKTKGKVDDKDKDKRDKKRRNRAGWCFVALATIGASSFRDEDIDGMDQEELDGMLNIWPDDSVADPDDIPDHVVEMESVIRVVSEMETAGPFGVIGKLLGKLFGKGSKPSGKDTKSMIDKVKEGGRTASKRVIDKAKASGRVKEMIKKPGWTECLATTAAAGTAPGKRDLTPLKNFKVEGYHKNLNIDWSRDKDPDFKKLPEGSEDKEITVRMSKKTDDSQNEAAYRTYLDGYIRSNRINYEGCTKVRSLHDNEVTDVDTQGGCCTFYDADDCKGEPLFSMANRQDGQLKGDSNDAISSFWCTFDLGCKGAPGQK